MSIGIYVEYEAQPNCFDDMLRFLRRETEECMRNDEGCLRMELAVPDAASGRLILSELWRDRQAIEQHRNHPRHSHDWQRSLVAAKRVLVCSVIASPTKEEALAMPSAKISR